MYKLIMETIINSSKYAQSIVEFFVIDMYNENEQEEFSEYQASNYENQGVYYKDIGIFEENELNKLCKSIQNKLMLNKIEENNEDGN